MGRRVRGAHTLGFNNTSVGIAVLGNFEREPSATVVTRLVKIAAWKLDRNDRDPRGTVRVYSHGSDLYKKGERVRLPVIDGHRDTNSTACPGQLLYDLLPDIRVASGERVDEFS
ncbi:MAG: N-acetylmuramoyl-L-alanine amidase [Nocardioides sp.]